MQQQARPRGLSANTLKLIAIIAMTVDHIAWAFVPMASVAGIIMHSIGRLTGPIMFFFIPEGYHHTHDVNRYTLRLGLFTLVSYVPFILFSSGDLPGPATWTRMSVIFTLLLGLLAVRALNEIRNGLLRGLCVAGLILASIPADWGITGVVVVVVFELCRGSFKKQALGYTLVMAIISILPCATSLYSVYSDPALAAATASSMGLGVGALRANLLAQLIISVAQLLPLIPLAFYNGQKSRSPSGNAPDGAGPRRSSLSQLFFYIYYPAHLLIIALVQIWLLGPGVGMM